MSEAEIENEIEVMEKFRTNTHEHIIEILRHGDLGTEHYFIDMEYCNIHLDQYIRGDIYINSLMDYQKAIADCYLFYICARVDFSIASDEETNKVRITTEERGTPRYRAREILC